MKPIYPIAAAAMLSVAVLSWTIHPGETWGDDFAQYVAHARNIAEGRAYDDTGHLFGVGAYLGPKEYPPLLPLILAPIYRAVGLNFLAFKSVNVVAIGAGLIAWGLLAQPLLGTWISALFVVTIGLHPLTREIADHVLSEPLYFALLAWALLGIERRCAASGAAIAAAALTRVVGFALVPIAPLVDLIRTRRVTRRSLAGAAIALAMVAASVVIVPGQLTYYDDSGVPFSRRALRFAQLYATDAVSVLPGVGEVAAGETLAAARVAAGAPPQAAGLTGPGAVTVVAIVAWIVLVFVGLVSTAGPLAVAICVGLHAAVMLVHSGYMGERGIWPFMPAIFLWLLAGLARLEQRVDIPRLTLAAGTAALVINLAIVPVRPYAGTILDPDARAFLSFVGGTPHDAVFIFPKPRALALLTGRRGLAAGNVSEERLEAIIRDSGATYLAAAPFEVDGVASFALAHPTRYTRVFASAGFEVFAAR